MRPRSTLEAFDRYLLGRGLALEAVVIGGAALSLLGVITRPTRDCDVAICDREFDLSDCLSMAPTAHELTEAGPWVERQDLNPGWPTHVQGTLADLGKRLGHAS
jgi:hypothetical protein